MCYPLKIIKHNLQQGSKREHLSNGQSISFIVSKIHETKSHENPCMGYSSLMVCSGRSRNNFRASLDRARGKVKKSEGSCISLKLDEVDLWT